MGSGEATRGIGDEDEDESGVYMREQRTWLWYSAILKPHNRRTPRSPLLFPLLLLPATVRDIRRPWDHIHVELSETFKFPLLIALASAEQDAIPSRKMLRDTTSSSSSRAATEPLRTTVISKIDAVVVGTVSITHLAALHPKQYPTRVRYDLEYNIM